jgi:hypothetical protein
MIKRFASQFRGFAYAALTFTGLAASSFAGAATQPIQDVDAPARKPYQDRTNFSVPAGGGWHQSLMWVPANQRLVIEHVSGKCSYISGYAALESRTGASPIGFEYLPGDFLTKYSSVPVEFFANPGELLEVVVNNVGLQSGYCTVSLSGYFVDLP